MSGRSKMRELRAVLFSVSVLLTVLVSGVNAGYVDIWTIEQSPTSQDLNDVCAVTKWVAWAVGDNGVVLERTQAGQWQSVTISGITQSDWDFQGVFFCNASLGFIVGEKNAPPDIHKCVILKTENGGGQWDKQELDPPHAAIPPTAFYDVYFTSPEIGWISAGNGYTLRTTDGGNVWEWKSVKEAPDSLSNCYQSIWSAGATSARTTGDNHGIMAKSTDGGQNFTAEQPQAFETLYTIPDYGNLNGEYANPDIYCSDWDHVFVALSEGYVGRGFWTKVSALPTPEWFEGVWSKGTHVCTVGSSGTIMHSTDNGSTWTLEHQDPAAQLNDVDFAGTSYADGSHFGWAVGAGGTISRDSTRSVCAVTQFGVAQYGNHQYHATWQVAQGSTVSSW
jgi:photosystem II stability/assembly factor-like uncharacterized protein